MKTALRPKTGLRPTSWKTLLQRGGPLIFLLLTAEAVKRWSDWVKSCNQHFASADGWMEGWLQWLLLLLAPPPLCCSTCNCKKKNQASSLWLLFSLRKTSSECISDCSLQCLWSIRNNPVCVCLCGVRVKHGWGAANRTEGFSNPKCPQKHPNTTKLLDTIFFLPTVESKM